MSPVVLLLALLYMAADAGRRGYTLLLDGLWAEARTLGLRLRVAQAVSAAAFCVARRKLSKTLFLGLVRETAHQTIDAAGRDGQWKGRRVYAIDGSKIAVKRSRALNDGYGGATGAHHPQMLAMVLLDVIVKTPLDFVVGCYRASERALMRPLLRCVSRGAVLLLDRGFEGRETFRQLRRRGIDFVIRCRIKSGFTAIERFVRSGRREAMVLIEPPPRSRSAALSLRAVRCDLPERRAAVLVTTLTAQEASAQEICDLYWKRWRIETYFCELKARWFSARQFHSETPAGVEQEFGAQVLFTAIMTALLAAAAAREGLSFDDLSRKAAALHLHAAVTRLVLSDPRRLSRELRWLIADIGRRRKLNRPGRTYLRRSFAAQSKWGPKGINGTHYNGRTR